MKTGPGSGPGNRSESKLGSDPEHVIETKITVRYQETDRAGVVYYANYLVWFEVARTNHFKKKGVSYRRMEEEGCCATVTDAHCKYIQPVTYDDEIIIRSRITSFKIASLIFEYEVVRKEALVATGSTTLAFLDSDRKIRRIPARLRAALAG